MTDKRTQADADPEQWTTGDEPLTRATAMMSVRFIMQLFEANED